MVHYSTNEPTVDKINSYPQEMTVTYVFKYVTLDAKPPWGWVYVLIFSSCAPIP
nr:MAG TPA: hypothetical protein [Caudoviricetes sp.]